MQHMTHALAQCKCCGVMLDEGSLCKAKAQVIKDAAEVRATLADTALAHLRSLMRQPD